MKGMLGHVSDSKTTLWDDAAKWRKLWRLRLIHWLAGERAVLMNMDVKGLAIPVERELLVANALYMKIDLDAVALELMTLRRDLNMAWNDLFCARLTNSILERRLSAFCTEDLSTEDLKKVEPGPEILHVHDDHDSLHSVGIVHHGDNQDGGKYLVCSCGAKRGVRMVQVRVQEDAGWSWTDPQPVCLNCRRSVIRGLYRLCSRYVI